MGVLKVRRIRIKRRGKRKKKGLERMRVLVIVI